MFHLDITLFKLIGETFWSELNAPSVLWAHLSHDCDSRWQICQQGMLSVIKEGSGPVSQQK